MLTKKDLGLLETMFKDAKREITEQVTSQVTERVTSQVIAKVVPQVTARVVPQVTSEVTAQVTSHLISKVGEMLQRNTDHLVELITTGFNIQDAGFDKADKALSNHEKRIGPLRRPSSKQTNCLKFEILEFD